MPRLAPACWLACAAVVVLATSGNTGCQAPGAAGASASPGARTTGKVVDRSAISGASEFTSSRAPEVLNPGNEKLKIAVTDIELELSSPRASHDFDEVTYVITLDDATNYNLQFASAADREDFLIRVSFKRLYRGTYTVKAFGDRGTEAFGEASFQVNDEGL